MSTEHWLDRWAKTSVAREKARPRWQKVLGNFGFGFIFIGALLNLALFLFFLVLGAEIPLLYKPWWPTYGLVSCIAGWYWRLHGQSIAEA
jgi:hypothetical protein